MRTADLDLATLRCEQDGRVLTVRVVSPPFNYMTAAMQDDLVRLVAAVDADDGVGAVILTGGVPGRYITHFDIADLLHSAETLPPTLPRAPVSLAVRVIKTISAVGGGPARRLLDRTPLASLGLLARFHAACEAILRSPAVWIAAVDGPCGGGGLEVSTFFDVRLASADAHFMLPELTIGLTTTFGGQQLAKVIGPVRALELMLEARAITAAEASEVGLVNSVVDGDVLAAAQELAARYARRPRSVVAAQKAVFHDDVPLSESLTREAVDQMIGLSTRVTRAALRCWLRRQDPSGDSTFLTDLEPWRDGTALDMNAGAGQRRDEEAVGSTAGRTS
ncbi:enoyl-CoA hydratase [Actinomycetospora sp. NBRC 106375]|uniref:enoyl-CoA hydratase/isomerase family protein n=1 Tax=Actinomycetospora sp. NBRC 106375 TaxID=3032207 RepID=UPI0024A053BB|nr:enoyl-CoA hydratase/isomerase family protein [Actinomycetospora sp. NBRC 106375]GLZ49161.1 enoyl-CoA hydratase [Actinomycetospora sp. NBRC 106375]